MTPKTRWQVRQERFGKTHLVMGIKHDDRQPFLHELFEQHPDPERLSGTGAPKDSDVGVVLHTAIIQQKGYPLLFRHFSVLEQRRKASQFFRQRRIQGIRPQNNSQGHRLFRFGLHQEVCNLCKIRNAGLDPVLPGRTVHL